jgi:hypothetical protein
MSENRNPELTRLVEETIRTLYGKGIEPADLAPLLKLYDALKEADSPSAGPAVPVESPMPAATLGYNREEFATGNQQHGPYGREGRRGEVEASEDLLARACAIIDVLVQSGQSPEDAAQVITRQLLSVGIHMPEHGGDARAWKRLEYWRNNLIHYKRAGPAWDAYCAFKERLANIPPHERLRIAVGERLWDQRRQEFSSEDIA